MIFVTMIETTPGSYEESLRAVKRLKIPENIKIREFLGLFGGVDVIIIFEADDEKAAVDFISHIACYVQCKTSFAVPIDEFTWTR